MTTQTYDPRDLAFLSDDGKWPHWPWLPVQKYVQDEKVFGVVPAGTPRVLVGLNVWHGWTGEQAKAAPKFEYESFEKLLEDGWIID